jgi:hypothetical protein
MRYRKPETMVETFDLVVTIAELIALWVGVAVPLYLVARAATHGRAEFGQSLGATISGGIAYALVLLVAIILYGEIIGEAEPVYELALTLAFIAWLVFLRSSFQTGWSASAGLSFLSLVVFLGLNALLGVVLNVALPSLFQFPL